MVDHPASIPQNYEKACGSPISPKRESAGLMHHLSLASWLYYIFFYRKLVILYYCLKFFIILVLFKQFKSSLGFECLSYYACYLQMYPMLERISPRTRKLELFARMHNTHAGYAFLTDSSAFYFFILSLLKTLFLFVCFIILFINC